MLKILLFLYSLALLTSPAVLRAQDLEHTDSLSIDQDSTQAGEQGPKDARLFHVEAGFGGVISSDKGATQHADATLDIICQWPVPWYSFWLDGSITAGFPFEKTRDDGFKEEFTLFGLNGGIGHTWAGDRQAWYYTMSGGLSFYYANLRIRPEDPDVSGPDEEDHTSLAGAYLRGTAMLRILDLPQGHVFVGAGVQGEGTTSTRILGRRLNNSGITIMLLGGVTGF